MSTMKVWRFARYGTPEVLALEEHPMPRPRSGEVLIKIVASAVNPSDVKNVNGHFKAALPRVPGRDFAGVIVEGDGREGEQVWGSAPGYGVAHDGTHAEYIVLPSDWVGTMPKNMTAHQAAAIGVPYLAAWTALATTARLQPGEIVLITGVSGAVGRAATQIAHWRGAQVIGVSRSADNPSEADAIIDLTTQDLTSEARALTDGKGVNVVLDAIGGSLFEQCLSALCQGGRQVAIASNPPVVSFNLVDFYHGKFQLFGVDTMGLSGLETVAMLNQLRDGFEQGFLSPPEICTWAFDAAPEAYTAVLKRENTCRQVLILP